MRTAISALLLLAVAQPVLSAEPTASALPKWLGEQVQYYRVAGTPPVVITEREYQGQDVFVVDRTKACCDMGAVMYNQTGEAVCQLIGIVGSWDSRCKDFPDNNRMIRLIYEQ